MKLPSGKLSKTVNGSESSLKELMTEAEDQKLTGYFEIHLEIPEGSTKGQVVLKEGVVVLCDHEKGGKETPGKAGVRDILKDSMRPEARIEVHTAIDADMMITFFKNATVSPEEFNIDDLIAELEEEERKRQEEIERQKQEEARKEELKQELEGWRGQGYIVARLEGKFDRELAVIEKEFKVFEKDLATLKTLEGRLEELVPKANDFGSYVQSIESLLNNPDSIETINEQLDALQKGIDEQEMRREELRKRVKAWKTEGYVVDALEQAIEADLNTAWDKFTQYMDDIQKLKEADEKLQGLPTGGFDDETFEIEALLGNPEKLLEIQQKIVSLEELINTEKQKKDEIHSRVDSWKEEGFDVSPISEVFTKRLAEVESEVASFEQMINTLRAFKNEMEGVRTKEYAEELGALLEKTNDVSRIEDIRIGLEELKAKVAGADQKRTELNGRLEQLRGEGFDVSGLEAVSEQILWDYEKAFAAFDEKLATLGELEKKLDSLDPRWMDERIAAVRPKFKNVSLIDEIRDELDGMESDINAREQKRNAVKGDIETWKQEGYNVAMLEAIINEAIEPISTVHEQVSTDIGRLKAIEEELNGLDAKWFESDVEVTRALLKDPSQVDAAAGNMEQLREKITRDRNTRKELGEKFDSWLEQGFQYGGDRDALFDQNLFDLEKAMEALEGSIQLLISTREALEAIAPGDLRWFTERTDALKADLSRIDIAQEVGTRFKELVMEVMRQKEVREGLEKDLGQWKEEGYICTELEEKIEAPLEETQAAYDSLAEKITKLKGFSEHLASLDKKWFQPDADLVEAKLNDPEQIEVIEHDLGELEAKINEEKSRRGELKNTLDQWRASGYNVEKLDTIMEEELAIIETEFDAFEKDLKMLLELQAKLGGGGVEVAPPPVVQQAAPAPENGSEKFEFTELEISPELTFKTFVVGASNRFTHAAAQAVADKPADAYNPLFIWGGAGLGKTHLLNAIGNYISKNHSNMKMVYVTVEKFTNDLIEAVRHDKINEFRNTYRKADVLLIDDIQFLSGKESTQEEFFHTFNTLYSARKQIAITSDRPPKDIPTLEDRLRSRFEGGLITDIQPPSLETKIIILRREAKKQNLDVPDEVMHLLASKIKTNIRELEGALTKIAAYSELQKKKIDPQMAEEVLRDILVQKKADTVSDAGDSKPSAKSKELMKRLSSLKESLKDTGDALDGEAAPMAKCLNCGAMVPADTGKCPECGTQFGGEMFECPKCKQMVPTNAKKCPNCGVKFKSG